MNRIHSGLVVALVAPLLLAMSGADIPDLLRFKHFDGYVWVSESAAFDAEGRLRTELFHSYPLSAQKNLAANRDGTCRVFVLQPIEALPRMVNDRSLPEAARNARSIIVGNVVSRKQGFHHEMPGTMVGVAVIQELAQSHAGTVDMNDVVYVFIPYAKIVTPSGVICSRARGGLEPPAIGDMVMAFAFYPSQDERGSILALVEPDRRLIVQRDGERVYTPRNLQAGIEGLSLGVIARRVTEYRESPGRN